jgi:membrane peptidoglycan carboxypeptidase
MATSETTEVEQLKLGKSKPRSYALRAVVVALLVTVPLTGYLVLDELHSSRLQARYFAGIAHEASFKVKPGASKAIRFPDNGGPYDRRFGYADMPLYLKRLQAHGYVIESQAQQSQRMLQLFDQGLTAPYVPLGLFLPYREKDQGGLTLYDGTTKAIYQSRYPMRVYKDFDALPHLLVSGLLYIENHSLLDEGAPLRNPAIEWSRFGRALSDEAIHLVRPGYRPPGGSTLATQIEKYRHSPDGRTASPKEKLRQMLSASLRAYINGEDTTGSRRQLVVEYLNTVPLAARSGFGEVSGIGDGMWAWYGRDFEQINRVLSGDKDVSLNERATVFKEALSLMISQRSPSYYLNGDMKVLQAMTDSYLRLMAKDKFITPELRDAALQVSLKQQKERVKLASLPPIERKGANSVRVKLAGLLGVSRMYDLDRLDLTVKSTLDSHLQQVVTEQLIKLRDPDYAKSVGLNDEHLLQQGDPHGVTYSFTLIERTPEGNKLRIQADNFDQPFDINDGAKLDLGSTSKLRTLVSYLEVIAALNKELGGMSQEELAHLKPSEHEPVLRRWAIDYLRSTPDHSLAPMLAASVERTYSANPGETFYTGGGVQTFVNFDKNDNGRILTIREATQRSVNLVYVRLMRDIVHYYMYKVAGAESSVLDDEDDPKRQEYLKRFADREGKTFLAGFYHKYHGKSPEQIEDLAVERARTSPKRLAVIFRSIAPDASVDDFGKFMAKHYAVKTLDGKALAKLYDEFGPDKFNLADRGYLAGMHPLELWLVAYQRAHPDAGWSELVEKSADQRVESYQWLFKKGHKGGQDARIRQLIEVDAFKEIHKDWKHLGYPFDSLVPSYGSALGASADRPSSLAELMGIISNDGVRLPTTNIDSLHFAADTPYETKLVHTQAKGERVLPPEIPQLVRQVVAEVVDKGTARRVHGAFDLDDGTHIPIGGKTGTGDNRFKTFAKGGGLVGERVVSRSGAFVFYLGDRYFGTLVAYVAGPKAAEYKFTSALPVQVLKVLAPTLKQRLKLAPQPADNILEASSQKVTAVEPKVASAGEGKVMPTSLTIPQH